MNEESTEQAASAVAGSYWLVHPVSRADPGDGHVVRLRRSQSLRAAVRLAGDPARSAAAGVLIRTTASDSEGTLGGLVALSDPAPIQDIVRRALRRAMLLRPGPRCPHAKRPGGFPPRRGLSLLLLCLRDFLRTGESVLDRRFLPNLPTGDDD
jgi:hypothetical protein